jgi:hypothetical protein
MRLQFYNLSKAKRAAAKLDNRLLPGTEGGSRWPYKVVHLRNSYIIYFLHNNIIYFLDM